MNSLAFTVDYDDSGYVGFILQMCLSFGYKHCQHMKATNNSDISQICEYIRYFHISPELQ
jgi:hypothetical protein